MLLTTHRFGATVAGFGVVSPRYGSAEPATRVGSVNQATNKKPQPLEIEVLYWCELKGAGMIRSSAAHPSQVRGRRRRLRRCLAA
ncbi:hypothetical protein MIB92_14980, partial [Aestuariirhabdus sp. Z084]|uniref:hypothetical protein n=1 Tax=Aestuariirhabdus haliotis TaxID=2918751 RepID=UPI0020C0CCDA